MYTLLYNNGMNKKKALPQIKVGPFKAVKYYEADVSAPDAWFDIIANIGSKVITRDALFNVGANHILKHAIDNKFELTSVEKPSVGTVVAEKNRQRLQKKRKKTILKPNNLEVKGKFYVDPPSGWLYGFPAPYNQSTDGTIEEFLISKGYPKKDVKWASENCRSWYED